MKRQIWRNRLENNELEVYIKDVYYILFTVLYWRFITFELNQPQQTLLTNAISDCCREKQIVQEQGRALTKHSRHVWVEIKQRWRDGWWTLQSGKPQVKSIFTEVDMSRLLYISAVVNNWH